MPGRRRGSATVYVVLGFTVLVGMATYMVDYGKIKLAKAELRTAVDAATLAGCSGITVSPTEARTRAKACALANKVDGQPLVLLDSDIEFGNWDPSTRAFTVLAGSLETQAHALRVTGWKVRARSTAVSTVFLPVIGKSSAWDLSAFAISGTNVSTADIVIAQDISTSFVQELPDAKTGEKALLDNLYAQGDCSGFGVVAFAGSASTKAAMQPVSGNYTVLTNAINSLQVVNPGNGTDIAAGIEQAQTLFNAYGNSNSTRALIIVSDGAPTSSVVWAHRWMSATQLLQQAQTDANTMWAQKIHIYVVFMDSTNDQTGAANLRTLIRGNGVYVHVTDPTQLPTALASITQTLPKGLVK